MDEVLAQLKQRLSTLKIGSPLDETTEMGPLANKAHYEKILGYLRKRVKKAMKLSTVVSR